jgi:nascent polypeptide-associated complex subunit alpha
MSIGEAKIQELDPTTEKPIDEVEGEEEDLQFDPENMNAEQLANLFSKNPSRGEKKARKAMGKLGLKHIEGINRVVIKRPKNSMIAFNSPDVYKSSTSETYIVFGEARIEDSNAMAQAAEQLRQQQLSGQVPNINMGGNVEKGKQSINAAVVPDQEVEVVDVEGLNAGDIEMVMTQANCSKGKAAQALKENNNDIVNAIMSLTI